jgi:hypothetical protein
MNQSFKLAKTTKSSALEKKKKLTSEAKQRILFFLCS